MYCYSKSCYCIGAACADTTCPAHPNHVSVTVTTQPATWATSVWPIQLTPERVREIVAEEIEKYEVETGELDNHIRRIASDELNIHLENIEKNVARDVKDQVGKALAKIFAGNEYVDIVRKQFISMLGDWHRTLVLGRDK